MVVVTIDTLRADRLGASGFAAAHTPTLDQLAWEGVRCAQAVCQLPQTDPSHVALMTGLYPSTSGVKVHMVDKLAPGSQTLARVFARAGYRTGGLYSWVSFDPKFCGLDQGFQTYAGYVVQQTSPPPGTTSSTRADAVAVRTTDLTVNTADPHLLGRVDGRADLTTARALDWLGAAGPEPFFLWVHYFDPHSPYNPPPGYDHLFGLAHRDGVDGSLATLHTLQDGNLAPDPPATLARLGELYQGEIAYVDAQLGRLVGELRARGLLDETILVVTADHGESFGEHADWLHGRTVYASEIHVPLLLRYPRRLPAGAVVTAPV